MREDWKQQRCSDIRRKRIEDKFRLMAFSVAYHCIYAGIESRSLRFAKAILYSAQPIREPGLMEAWHDWAGKNSIHTLLDQGKEPPAILRPIIDAWRKVAADSRMHASLWEESDFQEAA